MPWRQRIFELFRPKGRIPASMRGLAFFAGLAVAGIALWMYVRQSFDAAISEWAVLYTALVLAFALVLVRSGKEKDNDD